MIQDTVVIGGECSLETRIEGDCDLTSMVEGDPDVLVVEGGGQTYPHYSGSYVVTPSTSAQTLDTDGKVMDNDVTIQAVAQGSATTPATIITADPTISVSSGGLITAQVSKTQQITPTVVEGYVETGTPGNVGVSGSNTEQLSTQGAQTIHPASTDQSIASGKYLTGNQTFKAVTVSGLTADKILQGNVIKIGDADDDDRIMSVTGTASGGITPTGTKSITANGTGIDVYNYQYADVAVPNSYSAGDEGKVVSNGALVSQTSDTVTTNDTYDTTLINSLTVNVSGGSGYTLEDIATKTKPDGDVDLTGMKVVDYGLSYTKITSAKGHLASGSKVNGLFTKCTSMTTANIIVDNGLDNNGDGTFMGCNNVQTVVFICNGTYNNQLNTCNGCSKLEIADLKLARIRTNFFQSCGLLDTLIIRNTTVSPLENITVFNPTKFKNGGTGGTIYIPKSLYDHLGDGTADDYQSATNWSTIYGYGTITWHAIEGSQYENYYADGTPISS